MRGVAEEQLRRSFADDAGIAVHGMLAVFAREISFKVMEEDKVIEHFAESPLFHKIQKSTAIFLLAEGIQFDRRLRFIVVFEFRIEIVP